MDFPIDMSLSVSEICSMLQEYKEEKGISFEIDVIAAEIYKYTSGYPIEYTREIKDLHGKQYIRLLYNNYVGED